MEFNLRTLKSDDMFLMFAILNRIGFKDLKESLTPEKIKDLKSVVKQGGESGDMSSAVGFNIVLTVVEILLKNLPSCKKEIYEFLSSVSGLSVKEVSDLAMSEFTELVIAVVQKDDFKDFFKVVARLFK